MKGFHCYLYGWKYLSIDEEGKMFLGEDNYNIKRLVYTLVITCVFLFIIAACSSIQHVSKNDEINEILFVGHHDGDLDIYLSNLTTNKTSKLTQNNRDDIHPTWSPDGNKIAYASSEHGAYEIYIMNADGSNKQRITANDYTDSMPVWAPDSQSIVFYSSNENSEQLTQYFLAEQKEKLLVSSTKGLSEPSISPNGKQLLYIENEGKKQTIKALDIQHNTTQAYTADLNVISYSWSPDSKFIALSGRINRETNLYLLTVADKHIKQLTFTKWNDSAPIWMPSGEGLLFFSARDQRDRAQLYQLLLNENSVPQKLSDSGLEEMHATISADGKSVGYVRFENRAFHTYVMNLQTKETIKVASDTGRTHLAPRFKPSS